MLKDRELPKADAMFAQGTPRILIKRLYIIGHLTTRQHAKRLDHAERKAFGEAG